MCRGSSTSAFISVQDGSEVSYIRCCFPTRSRGRGAALHRFIDFFTANIRDPNTRGAYGGAVRGFFA
jgi:hypothetical protein